MKNEDITSSYDELRCFPKFGMMNKHEMTPQVHFLSAQWVIKYIKSHINIKMLL